MTPEGKIKRKVSAFLKTKMDGPLWYDMPVPGGFGGSSLDYVGCWCGRFFSIETKKPGGVLTDRQSATKSLMERAHARVFVIDDGDTTELEIWMKNILISRTTTPFSTGTPTPNLEKIHGGGTVKKFTPYAS